VHQQTTPSKTSRANKTNRIRNVHAYAAKTTLGTTATTFTSNFEEKIGKKIWNRQSRFRRQKKDQAADWPLSNPANELKRIKLKPRKPLAIIRQIWTNIELVFDICLDTPATVSVCHDLCLHASHGVCLGACHGVCLFRCLLRCLF